MTLDRFRPYVSRFLDPFVRGFDRVGMTPNGVSVVAFGMAILAAGAFALGGLEDPIWYAVAAVLVFLNGWLDIVDGALAREQEVASAGGDLLDHVLDRYADIVVIAGLAAGIEDYVLGFTAVTGVVMTSYLARKPGGRSRSGLRRTRRSSGQVGNHRSRRLPRVPARGRDARRVLAGRLVARLPRGRRPPDGTPALLLLLDRSRVGPFRPGLRVVRRRGAAPHALSLTAI